MKGKTRIRKQMLAMMLTLAMTAGSIAAPLDVRAAETGDDIIMVDSPDDLLTGYDAEECSEPAAGEVQESVAEDNSISETVEAAEDEVVLSDESLTVEDESLSGNVAPDTMADTDDDDGYEIHHESVRELSDEEIRADKATGYTGVRTAEELYDLLNSDGDAYISLYNDIDGMIGDSSLTGGCDYVEYWCKMGKGTKALNLNGFTFSMSYHLNHDPNASDVRRNTYAENGSTLLCVGEGTTFILRDSNGGGTLHYDGLLKDSEKYWKDVRNIVEVNGGTFIMNGGYLEAGRSKKYTAGGSRRQIHGNGLVVGAGSTVTINAGSISGRGYYYNNEGYQRCGAINIKKNSANSGVFKKCAADANTSITINDGEFIGYASAHGIAGIDDGNAGCFKAIRGGYFYTTQLEYHTVNSDGYLIPDEAGNANVPLKRIDLDREKVWVKGTGYVTPEIADTMKYSDNDTEITPNDESTAGMRLDLGLNDSTYDIDASKGYFDSWVRGESGKIIADYTPVWPEDSIYGDGAPGHVLVCYWSVWDETGTYKVYPEGDGILKNQLDIPVNELFGGSNSGLYSDGTKYRVRCEIREDYEGRYSYRPKCTAEGLVRIWSTDDLLRVSFTMSTVNGDLVIRFGSTMSGRLRSLERKGYKYELFFTNADTKYEYTATPRNDKREYVITKDEMVKTKVGEINLGVECRVYKERSDGTREYIASDGDCFATRKYGYLPPITCPTDNSDNDKDNEAGSVSVQGTNQISLNSGIKNGYSGTIKWVNTDADEKKEYTYSNDPLKLTKANGDGGYWRTSVIVGGRVYYSPNGFWARFEGDGEVKINHLVASSDANRTITSKTVFSSATDKMSAEATLNGVTVSDPKFKWSLLSSPDDKVKTSAKTYATEAKREAGGTYTSEILFARMFASPQELVDGDYVFVCSFYDGNTLLRTRQLPVRFKVVPDKYIVKGCRNGEDLVDVSGSYIYSADGMPVDIEAGPDPSVFVNEGMYIDARIVKSDTTAFSRNKSDGKTYGGTVTPEAVDENGVKKVTYKYQNSSIADPVEFNILYPLNEYVIESVTAPVVGEKISDTKVTVPSGARYKASVKWLIGDSDVITEKFEADRIYTAVVKIIPDAGVVMPVTFEGDAVYLDSDQVSVKAKFDGDTDYTYLSTSAARDGFASTSSPLTTSPAALPVSTGTSICEYQVTYKTYPRLTSTDNTYIDRLGIDFDTDLEGKGPADVVFAYDPAEGIDTSAATASFKTSDGKDFTKFETGKIYTCKLTNLFTKGTYRFADDVKAIVNGESLSKENCSLNPGRNDWMDSVIFMFKVGAKAEVVSNLTLKVPAPVTGEEVETQYGDLVPSDPINSPEWTAEYFVDANDNGKSDAGENDFTADGGKFVDGKTYGVHVTTYGNESYVLGDGFTITCNGATKSPEMEGGAAYTDFILERRVPKTFTVSFDLNKHGDEAKKPGTQEVKENAKAAEPSPAPADPDYKFTGWFTDSTCSTLYDFDLPVIENIVLYAGWVENTIITYKVSFNLNGVKATPVEARVIEEGKNMAEPAAPLAAETEKKIFAGWYKTSACKDDEKYDFATAVNADIILYAKWDAIEAGDMMVRFDDDGEEEDGLIYKGGRYIHYYTSRKITPGVEVTDGYGHKLVEGVDYTIAYRNNLNVDKKGKPAEVTIKGKGNYKSTKKLYFYILARSLGDGLAPNKPAENIIVSETAAGEVLVKENAAAAPVVMFGDYQLKSKDYMLVYGNAGKKFSKKDAPADLWITILGRGNFTGSIEQIPVVLKTKQEMKESAVRVSLAKNISFTYDGEAKTLTGDKLQVKDGKGTVLTEGTDYKVSYRNNVNAGTAVVTVTGIGMKTGAVSKKFKIKPDKDAAVNVETITAADKITYTNSGAKPEVRVTVNRGEKGILVLDEGVDYKVSYTNNKKVGNKASYTVSFLKNYKGHKAVKKTFTVNPGIFNVEITAADKVYGKPGKYTSAPYVYLVSGDGNRTRLTPKDYTVVSYKIGGTDISNEKKYTLTTDSAVVAIEVKGKGNYAGTTVTEPAAYKIRKPALTTKYDLSTAKITDKDSVKKSVAAKEYTGKEINPQIDVYAKPIGSKKEEKVDPALYDVTYLNNVDRGNAVILITAKEDAENTAVGSRSVTFKIVQRGLARLFQMMK